MTKFLQEVCTMNEASWVAAIFNFGQNINNSGLDKDICTKFHGKQHKGHAEMTT